MKWMIMKLKSEINTNTHKTHIDQYRQWKVEIITITIIIKNHRSIHWTFTNTHLHADTHTHIIFDDDYDEKIKFKLTVAGKILNENSEFLCVIQKKNIGMWMYCSQNQSQQAHRYNFFLLQQKQITTRIFIEILFLFYYYYYMWTKIITMMMIMIIMMIIMIVMCIERIKREKKIKLNFRKLETHFFFVNEIRDLTVKIMIIVDFYLKYRWIINNFQIPWIFIAIKVNQSINQSKSF